MMKEMTRVIRISAQTLTRTSTQSGTAASSLLLSGSPFAVVVSVIVVVVVVTSRGVRLVEVEFVEMAEKVEVGQDEELRIIGMAVAFLAVHIHTFD